MVPDLKRARLERGFTLKEVSSKIQVSEKTLARYETIPGRVPVDVTVKLMRIYCIPLTCICKKKSPC
ncbi:helix-turn-helix domain-containing protein [Paenibacillus cineris]|uniref:helix-turn-helix domain-containing protein n=1 Tax=Paenibacillus cineris TaxID=237530 RepID=UPI001BB304C7